MVEGLEKLNKQLDKLSNGYKELERTVSREAVSFYKDRFRDGAWVDHASKSWKKRKSIKKGKGRATLVKTGRLKRSIRVVSSSPDRIVIGTDVPYAQVHNEGFRGTIQVKAHKRTRYTKSRVGNGRYSLKTRKEGYKTVKQEHNGEVEAHSRKVNMPKRQFMGESAYMMKKIERQITADILKALK